MAKGLQRQGNRMGEKNRVSKAGLAEGVREVSSKVGGKRVVKELCERQVSNND